MLLEFLDDVEDPGPLLRFYDWEAGEALLLRDAAGALATGAARAIAVDRLPFVKALGGITFTWIADPWDRGVLMPDDGRNFALQLPQDDWTEVAERVERASDCTGFNWLVPVTEVEVLLSWSGQW